MSVGIPERVYIIDGLPMDRAPVALVPYLDCVEGAVAVGGTLCVTTGRQITTIWALFRGGREVGRVTVDGPPDPRADEHPRPRQLVGLVAKGQPSAAQLARQINSGKAIWLAGAFALGAVLRLLFVLGTQHPYP